MAVKYIKDRERERQRGRGRRKEVRKGGKERGRC
jgi:hypothetical protein